MSAVSESHELILSTNTQRTDMNSKNKQKKILCTFVSGWWSLKQTKIFNFAINITSSY